jgi:hypothetical protein
MRCIYVLFGIFLLTPFCLSQDQVFSEEKLISILYQSKPDEKAAALRSIGVPDEVAQHYKDLNASMTSEISWQRLRPSSSEKAVALFLPCLDESDAAYLFLVGHTTSGWKVQDSYSANCHYKADVTVELAANITPRHDVILLHNDCESHGSGYVEHHLHVFRPINGKLREILNTEEFVYWSGWGEETGNIQRSLFVPVASTGGGTAIEETQITQPIDKQTGQVSSVGQEVNRRIWVWSPVKGHMTPSPFRKLYSSSKNDAP